MTDTSDIIDGLTFEVEQLEAKLSAANEKIEQFGGVREPVRWFAKHMETKLREHDDRGGWEGCDEDWLFERLREEVGELDHAINAHFYYNAKNVIRECADVANFAMMIADNALGVS